MTKKARTASRRTRREPMSAACSKQRLQATADARARIRQVTEDAAQHLPMTSDGLRFLIGGLMSVLTPLSAKVAIRTDDERDIPLDGQQLRDVGMGLFQESLFLTMARCAFKTAEERIAAMPVLCHCGHPKTDHVTCGIGWTCVGKPVAPAGSNPLLLPPTEPLCTCREFSSVRASETPGS